MVNITYKCSNEVQEGFKSAQVPDLMTEFSEFCNWHLLEEVQYPEELLSQFSEVIGEDYLEYLDLATAKKIILDPNCDFFLFTKFEPILSVEDFDLIDNVWGEIGLAKKEDYIDFCALARQPREHEAFECI